MPVVSLIWVSVSRPPEPDFCGRPGRRPVVAAAAALRPPARLAAAPRGAVAAAAAGLRPRRAGAALAALAALAGRPGRRLLAVGRSARGASGFLRGRPRLPAFSFLISSKTGSALSGYRCLRPWPSEGIRPWYIFL